MKKRILSMLLAFQMLTEGKYLRCAILSVVAFLFHLSAILVIPVYVVYWFLQTQKHLVFQAGNVQITGNTAKVNHNDIYLRNDGAFTGKLVVSTLKQPD